MQTLASKQKVKVLELEELAQTIESLKVSGKKVVLCHGVFDLLHIGHLRHFQEAKKLGHVLVVTLSPDKYVNKGPHRPAFPEKLRAEAIAAIESVDYVGLSRWPMAVELIQMLKPDFYVKGQDYADPAKDVTGGIELERRAIESVGGQIAFTDDITFSSTTLINRNLPVFSKEVQNYISDFGKKYSSTDINELMEKIKSMKVLVIGEAIIDEYVYCQALGKSGKEPMLAIKEISQETFAGGTLAIANNITEFAGSVGLVSFIGDDGKLDDFVDANLENVNAKLLRRQSSPTIQKKRFIENYFFSKLLSVYTINDAPLSESDEEALCRTLKETIPLYDAVIVADFGHNMLTQKAADIISQKAKFLALNTQSNAASLGYQTIFKYAKADYICITEGEARLEVRDKTGDLKKIVCDLAQKMKCKNIVVTRGSNGSIGYDSNLGIVETPSLAGEVVDRMGAGDAFLAVSAMCAAQNAPTDLIQFIGNAVGAQAVSTVGHRASIQKASLIKAMTTLLTV